MSHPAFRLEAVFPVLTGMNRQPHNHQKTKKSVPRTHGDNLFRIPKCFINGANDNVLLVVLVNC